jgi:hypothetical protein
MTMSQQPPFQPPEPPPSGQQPPQYPQPPQPQPQPQYQPPQYQQPQPGYQPPQQPGAHPGYGQPSKQEAPRHPGYGPTPGAGGGSEHQGGHSQPGHPQGARRNPLAVASVILGAVPSVLGLIFIVVQAGLIAGASSEAYGAVSLVQTVLQALLGIGALVLGLLALAKPGPGRALAGAGVALGAATLVGVLGAILYPLIFAAAY